MLRISVAAACVNYSNQRSSGDYNWLFFIPSQIDCVEQLLQPDVLATKLSGDKVKKK